MSFSEKILRFYKNLQPEFHLPEGVSLMNPFQNEVTWKCVQTFYRKFYDDSSSRIAIFGINPGRNGAGVTGIPFTDPLRLSKECGIPNDFRMVPELSSVFVYQMINEYGGVELFYRDFFITAVCPLGFIKNGKNLNYYDEPGLLKSSEPFLKLSIKKQVALPVRKDICFCLGEGKNFKCLSKLNDESGFFDQIIALAHPRFIMQYKRKEASTYISRYVGKFRKSIKKLPGRSSAN